MSTTVDRTELVGPVGELLRETLARPATSYNTDWDGSLVVLAVQEWQHRHSIDSRGLPENWFAGHCDVHRGMTDEEFLDSYIGVPAPPLRTGPLLFSAYCGTWASAIAAAHVEDERRESMLSAVADFLLLRAGRSPHGCVYHDAHADFVIPDAVYFAAPTLALAGTALARQELLDAAAWQLASYVSAFLDQRGLSRTMWTPQGTPPVYWSRATGWLAGGLALTLPLLAGHPMAAQLTDAFDTLAHGLQRHQRDDGGFHVLLDDPISPVDATGPAMAAFAIAKGVDDGLLDPELRQVAGSAWAATESFLDHGVVTHAYTGWAMNAARRQTGPEMFGDRDFARGLVLLAGARCVRPEQPA